MSTVTRSPNYPQLNLSDAIERARKIYKAEHIHRANDEVLAKNLGYNSLNGTSRSILSAMKKYGLLQADGDGFRVSDDAVDIIELPLDDPAHAQAVQRSAFRPALFAELFETFGTALPSDSNLRHYLIKKKFHPGTADEVIRLYRDTLAFVAKDGPVAEAGPGADGHDSGPSLFPADNALLRHVMIAPANGVSAANGAGRASAAPTGETNGVGRASAPPTSTAGDALQYRVSRNCKAHVQFVGPVTQDAVRKLIAHLQLSIDDFPEDESAIGDGQ